VSEGALEEASIQSSSSEGEFNSLLFRNSFRSWVEFFCCCFHGEGQRLGQGKGYYDRFISTIQQGEGESKKPLLVAVALAPQYIGQEENAEKYKRAVPVLDHDIKMDKVITPFRTILCQ